MQVALYIETETLMTSQERSEQAVEEKVNKVSFDVVLT